MANVGKVLATIKAVITRLVFACHGIIAIWQVTVFKDDIIYWYLASPILLLIFEGVFTLTIKENQEWKWFCPSVFIYLGLVVPAIWLLELHKVDVRLKKQTPGNDTVTIGLGVAAKIPTDMWVTLIEQFLMLTLIVGRWLLPKGDLTRDQLSQLLLVYIGTAADIIEFFDSFKDEKVASEKVLVLLTLAIWSWSLVQFTVVLTATKSRKSRGAANRSDMNSRACCCSIEVCAIMMNIALQDAPFLAFRLLIIAHYKIINYMNIFFTCKNTLVILLQIYRLYVLHLETTDDGGSVYRKPKHKELKKKEHRKHKDREHKKHHKSSKHNKHEGETSISVITDKRQERVEGGRIRAIILTNNDEIEELELSRLFKDQVGLENEKKRGKKKQKSESEESLNNIHHTTDDSGI
ncbi:transmembrane protein 26 [Cydia pomonella]|uniref:transmembrane protein 26 n=1 Tax=Cydia pomonella TaxID=82600 RepID=UPI002ADD713C|nr:transmembrane protein 26 [Cydia pomonella]